MILSTVRGLALVKIDYINKNVLLYRLHFKSDKVRICAHFIKIGIVVSEIRVDKHRDTRYLYSCTNKEV